MMASFAMDPNGMPIESIEDFDHHFDCVICLDREPNDHARALQCGHVFCEKCTQDWAKHAKHAKRMFVGGCVTAPCPACRTNVRPYRFRDVLFHAAPLDETAALQRLASDAMEMRRKNAALNAEIEQLERTIEIYGVQRAKLESTLDEVERNLKSVGALDDDMELDG